MIGKISERKSSVKLKKINKTKGHGNRHLNAYSTGGRRSARMVDYNADAVKICPARFAFAYPNILRRFVFEESIGGLVSINHYCTHYSAQLLKDARISKG